MAGNAARVRPKATNHRYYDSYRNFDKFYSSTSSAYKVDFFEDYRNENAAVAAQKNPWLEESVPRPEKQARRVKKPKTAARYLRRVDPRKKISKELVALMILIFAGMFGIVYTQSIAQRSFNNIKKLRTELAGVKIHNASMFTDLYENYDKDEIERIAVEKLNMTRRKPHQEVYVSVPKASYVVNGRPKPAAASREGFAEFLLNLIFGER